MNNHGLTAETQPCALLRQRQRDTAGLYTEHRLSGFPNGKRGKGVNLSSVDSDSPQAQSGGTRMRLPVRFFRTVAFIFALIAFSVNAAEDAEMGEITPRMAPQATEAALSVLQNARNIVQKKLANISAQANPLSAAVSEYRSNPTTETALKLLQREAVVAGIGAKESESIAAEAAVVSKACAGLAAQTQAAAEMLRPGLEKATRGQVEYSSARSSGLNELRQIHRALIQNGVTNETSMSPAEKRKAAALLRLTGAAELSERFLKMEIGATDSVINRLNQMTEQFVARQRNFSDLADAYRLHSASFKTIGASVAQVGRLIEVNQRFDVESRAAAELESELAPVDDVLGKTFESLPDEFSPAFSKNNTSKPGDDSTGLWMRFLRFIGAGEEPQRELVTQGGSSR